jgi:hypothetical protein
MMDPSHLHGPRWVPENDIGNGRVGDVARFKPTGVQLIDGRTLEGFDAVVLATGYANDFSWLPPDVEQRLGVEEDGLYLYRHVLPPRVPVRHQTPETLASPCGPSISHPHA